MSYGFTVYGIPQPKGSTRAFMRKGMRYPVVTSDNPRVKTWQRTIGLGAMAARGAGKRPAEGPVELNLIFALPRPQRLAKRNTPPHVTRPDIDKLARAVLDALKGIAFEDDGQVVRVVMAKRYHEADDRPHVHVLVTPEAPELFARSPLHTEVVQ